MGDYPPPLVEVPPYQSAEALAADLPRILTPAEVLALDVFLGDVVAAWTESRRQAGTLDDEAESEADGLSSLLYDALDLLPGIDIDYAHDVYKTYAEGDDHFAVETAAGKIHHLTVVDHDRGFALWHELIRHFQRNVRSTAYGVLCHFEAAARARDYEAAEAALTKIGLTWRDAQQLLDAYEDAERGERLFSLGQAALAKLAELANIDHA